MKIKIKRPLIVFAAGLVLLASSSIGATRAAKTYFDENAQDVDFSTSTLSVQLQEGYFNENNEKYDDFRTVQVLTRGTNGSLTFPAISDTEDFNIGQKYEENVRVYNDSPGKYDEYVRINLKKSWGNYNSGKDTELDPKYIEFELADGWIIDDKNEEGAFYYYTKPLKFEEAAPFIKSVKVNNDVWEHVELVNSDSDGMTIKNEYRYGDGYYFFVEVRVDAVQAHNAEDAFLGAWGVEGEFTTKPLENGTIEYTSLLSVNGSTETTVKDKVY